jgi:hypothetical protein
LQGTSTEITNQLRKLQRAQSINFHHDAITGTHNAVVGYDYDLRIVNIFKEVANETSALFHYQA